MFHHRHVILLLSSSVVLGACTTAKDYSGYNNVPERITSPIRDTRAITPPRANPAVPGYDYRNQRPAYPRSSPWSAVNHNVTTVSDRIARQDLLEISVYKVDDLSRSVRVDNAGFVTLPLVGKIRALGLTSTQLEQQIASRLGKSFMHNPQVSVLVKETSQNRITVEGAVRQPGVFQVSADMSLLQAIAKAGGLNDTSDDQSVMLFRKNGRASQQQRIDLGAVRRGYAPDVPLQRDDRIVVLEAPLNRRVVVEGAVTRPGVFPIKGRMTVLQALALAGGPNRLADSKTAVLLRYRPDGRTARYRVDLQAIRVGRAADPEMAPDDRLIVQQSQTRDILDQAKGIISPINLFP